MRLPEKINLFFDGSCTKNPGGIAGYGWLIETLDGLELKTAYGEVCRGEGATNNVAEWSALLMALKFLEEHNFAGELFVFGDSELVIKQINGQYKVNQKLFDYYKSCHEILSKYAWNAKWIAREENSKCDALSKLGTQIKEDMQDEV